MQIRNRAFLAAATSILAGFPICIGVGFFLARPISSLQPIAPESLEAAEGFGNTSNYSTESEILGSSPDFCRQWGIAASVVDVQIYTTANSDSSYVSQPTLRPGCVIKSHGWAALQREGVITAKQMRECKMRISTFAYFGSIKDQPIVQCVYERRQNIGASFSRQTF